MFLWLLCLVLCVVHGVGAIGLTCGSCSDVLKPNNCLTNTTCESDQLCGATQYLTSTNNEWRFELKCMSKRFCDALQPDPSNNMCVRCCSSDLCNTKLCNNGQTINSTSPTTTAMVPTTTMATTTTMVTTTTAATTITTVPSTVRLTTQTTRKKPTFPSTTKTITVTTESPIPLITTSKSLILLNTAHPTDKVDCRAEHADYLNIYKNGKKIQSLSGQGVITYQISISDWKNTTYTCEGVNSKSNRKTNGTVSVIATGIKPYFPVKYESQITVRDGDHIGLSCIPEGDPKPTVTWTVPKHMDRQTRDHIVYHYANIELEIKNMVPDLAGSYTCTAHNQLGTANFTYHVRYTNTLQTLPSTHQTTTLPLLVKPDVYLEKQINVTEGEPTVAIPCTADGIPMPTIKWTTAGYMIQEEDFEDTKGVIRIRISDNTIAKGGMPSNIQQYKNYIILHNVGFQDSRYYICTATNAAGSTIKAIHVVVISRPHVPPVISLVSNMLVKYDAFVKLDCQNTGFPDPKITWSFNGKPIGTTKQLVIQKASLLSIGAYTCTAINDAGKDQKTVVLLVTGTAPQLIPSQPTTVMASRNKAITLTCTVKGEPTPAITWTFKPFVGTSKTVQQSLSSDNSTLTLTNVDKSGTVTCTASNPFGQIKSSFSIIAITTNAVLGR